jgi:hypothetical protein
MSEVQPLIYKQMAAILAKVSPVAKSAENPHQHYRYRTVVDIAGMLQPLLAEHGVIAVPSVLDCTHSEYTTSGGTTMRHILLKVEWSFYAADGSCVAAIVMGEGSDSSDKAANKAMTASQKYALTQCFTVPWGEDSEEESPAAPARAPAPQQPPRAAPAAAAAAPANSGDSVATEDQINQIIDAARARSDTAGVHSFRVIDSILREAGLGGSPRGTAKVAQMKDHLRVVVDRSWVPIMLEKIERWVA